MRSENEVRAQIWKINSLSKGGSKQLNHATYFYIQALEWVLGFDTKDHSLMEVE